MERRTKVVVAVGFAVLVGIAAIGVRAWWNVPRPGPWEEQAIGELALSPDRRTLWVRAAEYLSGSCYESRAEVVEGERWTVRLETRRTDEWCTLEGCIDEGDRRPVTARVLDPGEHVNCPATIVELDRAVPPDVAVVAA